MILSILHLSSWGYLRISARMQGSALLHYCTTLRIRVSGECSGVLCRKTCGNQVDLQEDPLTSKTWAKTSSLLVSPLTSLVPTMFRVATRSEFNVCQYAMSMRLRLNIWYYELLLINGDVKVRKKTMLQLITILYYTELTVNSHLSSEYRTPHTPWSQCTSMGWRRRTRLSLFWSIGWF